MIYYRRNPDGRLRQRARALYESPTAELAEIVMTELFRSGYLEAQMLEGQPGPNRPSPVSVLDIFSRDSYGAQTFQAVLVQKPHLDARLIGMIAEVMLRFNDQIRGLDDFLRLATLSIIERYGLNSSARLRALREMALHDDFNSVGGRAIVQDWILESGAFLNIELGEVDLDLLRPSTHIRRYVRATQWLLIAARDIEEPHEIVATNIGKALGQTSFSLLPLNRQQFLDQIYVGLVLLLLEDAAAGN